jgi:hypothetical protein
VADLTLDTATPLSGTVTVESYDGKLKLIGTVRRSDVFADSVRVLAVGGTGDFEAAVAAKGYRMVPARIPLADILSAAGQTLSSTSDASALSTTLAHWSHRTGAASTALASLLEAIGATWRILPDGTFWVGSETWPNASAFDYTLLAEDPARERAILGVEAPPPLFPGTVFRDRRVSAVVHTIDTEGIFAEVWYERESESPRLLGALKSLIRKAFARIDYLAPYACRVVAQNGDGTLELRPDDEKLPGYSRVPIRAGLPGVVVKVAAGARVTLQFERGDPSRPMATVWEQSGMTELQIGGAAPIMRQGDVVSTSLPPGFTFAATIAGSLTQSGPCTITVVQAPVPLIGMGVTGSGLAKA